MRIGTSVLALLFSALGATNAGARGDDASADLAAMQGTWQLLEGVRDGVALSATEESATQIEIDGQTFRFPLDAAIGTSASGTLSLDASPTPHHIDSVAAGDGAVSLGLYEIDGDAYRVVFASPGKPRPTAFGSQPGSGYLYQRWQRLAQPTPKLVGSWSGQVRVDHHSSGIIRSINELRITSQDGELVRGATTWTQLGPDGQPLPSGSTGSQPLLGVVGFDGKSLTLVEHGDGGRYDVRLVGKDAMQVIYTESGAEPLVYRGLLTRQLR